MLVTKYLTTSLLIVCASVVIANDEPKSDISQITDNIVRVCDKPESAGNYWDISVKSGGEAEIKLKLAELGVTGEVAFSKSEWDGIQRTVEDNKNYRDCVKNLAPLFIEKFTPMIKKEEPQELAPSRILGGVKWQKFGAGLKITLSSCYRQSNSVTCEFMVNSKDSDVTLTLSEGSAIYDQKGHRYRSSQLAIANFRASFKYSTLESLSGELVQGVNTKVVAKFTNVGESSVLVSKAMLISTVQRAGANKEKHTFTYRDIKIALD